MELNVPHLFEPLTLREITFPNRIGISPMCQYSAIDGHAQPWHTIHLGARAVGGAGMVMVEASAIEPRGRISPEDLGIWSDDHIPGLRHLAETIRAAGSIPAIQIAHAGRKANTTQPWAGGKPFPADAPEAWEIIGPSPISFDGVYQTPREMTASDILDVQDAFVQAARRADEAGFDVVEIHGAHGYLICSFLSPLSNQRSDSYGGSFDNRSRFLLETTQHIRAIWPDRKPLFVRLSSTEWMPDGWNLGDTIALSGTLGTLGVDLIDCSSGGNNPAQHIQLGPGYQVPFAEAVRRETGIPTAAVGLITEPTHADEIIRNGRADLVLIGRESLRDPYWPRRAAATLNQQTNLATPNQYHRAW
jgi:2,4-dienoyl-CoA reductase-like NADH-dependent reductase (Old Yellow Enzyme family)